MNNENMRVFLHPQRSFDQSRYMADFNTCMRVCDERHIPGMLISSSGADFYDPWALSQYYLQNTTHTSVIIVVNPVYTHPFTAARMAVSLAELYERRLYFNFVIGSNLIDLNVLGDHGSHDERYSKLDEFIHIFKALVFTRKKFSFKGKYYEVENLSLLSKMKEELLPEFFICGHSEAAIALAKKYEVLNLQMIPAENPQQDISDKIYALSVVCRDDADEVEKIISTQYPKDRFGEILFQQNLKNTDSEWKEEVFENITGANRNRLFRAEPVLYKYTDNPCLAGTKTELKEFFKPLKAAGLKNILATYNNKTDLDNFLEILS